jgi:hypothetical protein
LPDSGEWGRGHYDRSLSVAEFVVPAADCRNEAAELAAPDVRAIINMVCRRVALAAGKPRFGDKTPV